MPRASLAFDARNAGARSSLKSREVEFDHFTDRSRMMIWS